MRRKCLSAVIRRSAHPDLISVLVEPFLRLGPPSIASERERTRESILTLRWFRKEQSIITALEL
jgi:hypothetical protein